MPRGKYDNGIRTTRYTILREYKVPRVIAILVRDWKLVNYQMFIHLLRKKGLDYVCSYFSI